jgi:hypothetical protein
VRRASLPAGADFFKVQAEYLLMKLDDEAE